MSSISIPFRFENNGVRATSDNSVIARQKIADVLATRPYERVMRPEYGAGISNLLFEPFDPLVFMDYKMDARVAINESVSNAYVKDIIIKDGGLDYNGESTLVAKVVYDVAGEGTTVYNLVVNATRLLTEETGL